MKRKLFVEVQVIYYNYNYYNFNYVIKKGFSLTVIIIIILY